MATPLIPFAIAWLIGIWIASRVALPTVALSLATVVAEPDVRGRYTNLRVEADRLIIPDQPIRTVKGLLLVQAPLFPDFCYR